VFDTEQFSALPKPLPVMIESQEEGADVEVLPVEKDVETQRDVRTLLYQYVQFY
jgi:hypothetical protein